MARMNDGYVNIRPRALTELERQSIATLRDQIDDLRQSLSEATSSTDVALQVLRKHQETFFGDRQFLLEDCSDCQKVAEPFMEVTDQLIRCPHDAAIIPAIKQCLCNRCCLVRQMCRLGHDSSSLVGGSSNPHPTGEGPSTSSELEDEA